jgi:hypothetical protein
MVVHDADSHDTVKNLRLRRPGKQDGDCCEQMRLIDMAISQGVRCTEIVFILH